MPKRWTVMVPGGGGYVGSALIPALLDAGHAVSVLDLFLYGEDHEVFGDHARHPALRVVKGDVRDPGKVAEAMTGCDAVIHLACISNDPSFELDPSLGKSINFDSFRPLVVTARDSGVRRFVYASSSSVYGIKEGVSVTEDLSLEPLTDYSKFKAMCEDVLAEERAPGFTTVVVRPATVCGYATRQRLDVVVNILTNHAVNNGKIKIFGGPQKRPNIHIKDMVRAYLHILQMDDALVDGGVYNVGYENHSLDQLGEIVCKIVHGRTEVEHVPTYDLRSYHVSSERIKRDLGFEPQHSIEEAVRDLVDAFDAGLLPDSLHASKYFNIKRMQEVELT